MKNVIKKDFYEKIKEFLTGRTLPVIDSEIEESWRIYKEMMDKKYPEGFPKEIIANQIKRAAAMRRAIKIFLPVIKNVTDCFILYQSILAEHERPIYITQKLEEKRKLKVETKKPEKDCPKCNSKMSFFEIRIPKGKNNVYGYKSKWECLVCAYEEYNKLNLTEQSDKLEIKNGNRCK